MQISLNNSFYKPLYPNYSEKQNNVSVTKVMSHNNLMSPNAVYFKGEIEQAESKKDKTETIGYTDIPKITSDEEFDEVMANLKKTKSWTTYWEHGRATKWEAAILPYAGKEDRSCVFNIYMGTGRICDPRFTEEAVRDHIRVMDYALQKYDEEHGKYEGIVYRCGELYDTSFISTASNPDGMNAIITDREDYHKPFYIIYTKHGHKIYEMQNRISTNYAYQRESEVILDPGTKFEEITEITPEMEQLKKDMQYAVRDEYGRVHDLHVVFVKEV